MRRNPPDNDKRAAFAALLAEHLAGGAHPDPMVREPWTYERFASKVQSSRANDFVAPGSVANWCKGRSLPAEIEPILRALFGPDVRQHRDARETLREAFLAARAERFRTAKRATAGIQWFAGHEEFAIDHPIRSTDRSAAADPIQQQLQIAIRSIAAELIGPAKRLANSRTWGGLSATAARFHAAVAGDPMEMPSRLGNAYHLSLELGTFLEIDRRLQSSEATTEDPLAPDIYRPLMNLVQIAASWLRGFPTIVAWDDAAGKALVRAALLQPARDFVRIAHTQQAISNRDAAEVEWLAEAANGSSFQGQKAGNRVVYGAQNLILEAAKTLAASQSNLLAPESNTRVQRAAATFAKAKTEVEMFASRWPNDLGQALNALMRGGQRIELSEPPVTPDSSIPDDIEALVETMILDGHAPPVAWRHLIRQLDFYETKLNSLALLSGLIDLQRLDLTNTAVRDISPLANLPSLRSLELLGLPVTDLSPLSGLTALQSLGLRDTTVADLSPLAGLVSLRTLDLRGTLVRSLLALSKLTSLQNLDLGGTKVTDLSPLSGLTALKNLNLTKTQVMDLRPLSGLTALQRLDLIATPVTDTSPLSDLTELQSFYMTRE